MSVFCEFHKAWRARFPGHELPGAWEEDVRTNLAKHRARAALLKEELEKEEFYVDYLERLLEDVQRHKTDEREKVVERINHPALLEEGSCGEERGQGEGRESSLVDKCNAASSTTESLVTQAINSALGQSNQRAVLGAPPSAEEPGSPPGGSSVKDLARRFTASSCGVGAAPARAPSYSRSTSVPASCSARPPSQNTPQDESHFVTVIPISGTISLEDRQKRVPPTPPPKTFRRPNSIGDPRPPEPLPAESAIPRPQQSPRIPRLRAPQPTSIPKLPLQKSASYGLGAQTRDQGLTLSPSPASSVSSGSRKSLSKSSSSASSVGATKGGALTPRLTPRLSKSVEIIEATNPRLSPANSSLDNLSDDEPLYDTVAPDELDPAEYNTLSDKSLNGSDTARSVASSNDLGLAGSASGGSPSPALDFSGTSPKHSNYVNIDFFLQKRQAKNGAALQRSGSLGDDDECGDTDDDDDDEVGLPTLLRSLSSDHDEDTRDEPLDIDSGVYGSSVESTTHIASASPTPPASHDSWSRDEGSSAGSLRSGNALDNRINNNHNRSSQRKTSAEAEAEQLTMYKCIISSILESETVYLECLDVVLQYMKALKATLTTSQPVISPDDFSTVFYRIPELHAAHSSFLKGLRQRISQWDSRALVGDIFKLLASKLDVYAQFLQNYTRAVETVRRCSTQSQQFADITRSIKLRSLQGQAQSLEDLLHRPVARVQKNALVLHDLLKYTPENHNDHEAIKEALNMTQNFLTHLSMMQTEAMFPTQDRPQRHLVRNSFIVELVDGHRKLRHLFLFNDVLVCAKYKATGRAEKFTFEVKWYISLHDIVVIGENVFDSVRESSPPNLVALKTQASTVRDQIKRQELHSDLKVVSRINISRGEKRRKKLSELEAQLILASPNLPLRIGKRTGQTNTFLLTSEYERDQWGEAIRVLQANTPGVGGSSLTLAELQSWITAYRSFLKTNMGTFLLKSNRDDSLLLGDLHIVVSSLHGLTSPANMFLCFEVDSYGHFFRKAKTKTSEGIEPHWNQDFIVELEGSQIVRILCYEDNPKDGVQLRGKAHLELSRSWLSGTLVERRVSLQDLVLVLSLKFLPPEATLRGVPSGKPTGLFGASITQVCRREKRSVPFVVTRCVREVERRGLNEVGIYRVSGLASDISKLKKSFESNPYEAEQLVKEVDIHSVTGLLKLYLRELPEALFTDDLYPRFFEAFSAADPEYRKTTLLKLFSSLHQLNQSLIVYLLEHLVKINQHDNLNKMSLHNLATVFGPTVLRPAIKSKTPTQEELLTASTVDVMAQAGILHFFLKRRAHGEPVQVLQS